MCHVRNPHEELPRRSVVYDGLPSTRVDNHGDGGQAIGAELKLAPEARLVGMVARGDHAGDHDLARRHAELSDLIATLGMSDSFTSRAFARTPRRCWPPWNVAVLATHYEGFGLALLEAMAQGRPVVATRVGGIPEFVIHGATGLLHEHQDDEDLAAKVMSLLDDSERAAHLGSAGR